MMPRNPSGKLIVSLLSLLAVLSMGVAGASVYLQLQVRQKLAAKEQELMQSMGENDRLRVELKEAKQETTKLKDELADTQLSLGEAEDELELAKQAQQTLAQSVDDRQKEIERLMKDLEQAKSEREDVEKKLAQLKKDQAKMESQVAQTQIPNPSPPASSPAAAEMPKPTPVELDRVVVAGEPASGNAETVVEQVALVEPSEPMVSPVTPSMRQSSGMSSTGDGRVIVVNREYEFVVMNIGKNQGISIGQEFRILRGDEVLGTVKVEKLYDELSAAAILPDSKGESIREGDIVKAL